MPGAARRDAGLACGLFNTTQQISAALGVAVLSTLAAAQTRSLHPTGTGSAAALAAGYHLAFAVGTGLAVAAIIVAAVALGGRRLPAAPAPGRRYPPRHARPGSPLTSHQWRPSVRADHPDLRGRQPPQARLHDRPDRRIPRESSDQRS